MDAIGTTTEFHASVLVARMLEKNIEFALGATIVTRQGVLAELGDFQQFRIA